MAMTPDALTAAIEKAFEDEWGKTKTIPLPAGGAEDRRLMFAAVARGLLTYLEANEQGAITEMTFETGDITETRTVTNVDFDITL